MKQPRLNLEIERAVARRRFLTTAAAGTVVLALGGGSYAFAAGLVLLALTGMTLLPGRKGIKGRGAVLVLAGVLVPVAYVLLTGGP